MSSAPHIDVVKDNSQITWFDETLSDHFPVVLSVDASEER